MTFKKTLSVAVLMKNILMFVAFMRRYAGNTKVILWGVYAYRSPTSAMIAIDDASLFNRKRLQQLAYREATKTCPSATAWSNLNNQPFRSPSIPVVSCNANPERYQSLPLAHVQTKRQFYGKYKISTPVKGKMDFAVDPSNEVSRSNSIETRCGGFIIHRNTG